MVDIPNSNILALFWTLIFDWYVVRCGSENQHQKVVCSTQIRPSAQNMMIIIGSIGNTIEGACIYAWSLTEHNTLYFHNEYDSNVSSISDMLMAMDMIWMC